MKVADLMEDLETGDRSAEFLKADDRLFNIDEATYSMWGSAGALTGLFKGTYETKITELAGNIMLVERGRIEPRKGVLITNIVNE